MQSLGLFGLVIAAFLILFVGMAVVRLFGGRSSSERRGFSMGHATLTCPHCGEETRAGVPTCEHCGRDL